MRQFGYALGVALLGTVFANRAAAGDRPAGRARPGPAGPRPGRGQPSPHPGPGGEAL